MMQNYQSNIIILLYCDNSIHINVCVLNHQAREALRDRIGRSLQLTAPRLHSSRLLEVLGSDTRTIQYRLHNGRCTIV